jgi:hypothetical protein
MKIIGVDIKASTEGTIALITSPLLDQRVFDTFSAIKISHPHFGRIKMDLSDGKLILVLDAPPEDRAQFLEEQLNTAEALVQKHDREQHEQTLSQLKAETERIRNAAKIMKLPILN